MQIKTMIATVGAATFGLSLACAAPAAAQATRTWVSGVGDDVNPCSRTAPCKTFAGAISKTAAGGQINCMDPGAFGALTITKSLSIICDDVEAGVLAGGSNGIVINAAATDKIYLSGLDLLGTSSATNGVNIFAAGTVYVVNTTIRNFNAVNGAGINFHPTAGVTLHLENVVLSENGNGATGAGLLIAPSAGGVAFVTATRLTSNNNGTGISMSTVASSGAGQANIALSESTVANNVNNITVNAPANAAAAFVTDTVLKGGSTGITASGAGATLRLSATTITANTTGVSIGAGALVLSYGDNLLDGNTSNGFFSGAVIPKK